MRSQLSKYFEGTPSTGTLANFMFKTKVLRGGGRVSWDEVREWHGHTYSTKCKIDS